MEMHQIRYFLAVARTLNFTRAAEECNVAQPSLTRAIKNLEAELGGDLFRRERAGSHLTNLGRTMLPLLTQCQDSSQAAKSQAASLQSGAVSPLRITLSQTIDLDVLARIFSALQDAFQDIQISCQRAFADQVVAQLRSGDAEIALAGPLAENWDRMDAWPLFKETHSVVMPTGHAFSGRKIIEPADLGAERIITRPFCEQWADCRALLLAAGIDINQCHDVVSDADALRLLEAGFGVCILPASTRLGDGLESVPLADPIPRTVQLYCVAGRQQSPALASLINLLRAADWQSFEAATPGD